MADESTKAESNGSELPKDVLAESEGPRENLVVTAVKFLQNPKVKQSPLAQKKAFLESKGLTKEEIQLAVQRAGVTDESSFPSSGLPSQQQQYPPVPFHNGAVIPGQHLMPPPPPPSPWMRARDIATTMAIVAAVSYAVYSLFKKFLEPSLVGKSAMEARQERLEESVARLHAAVAESNAKMVGTMKAIRESITGSRDSALQAGYQQENMALNEIKAEIASLKGLLLNRRQFPPPPITSPVVPAWQKSLVTDDNAQTVVVKQETSSGDSAVPVQNGGGEGDQAVAADDQDKDRLQPVDTSPVPSNQMSDDNLAASASGSGSGNSFHTQSSDSPYGLDAVKSDSGTASEAD